MCKLSGAVVGLMGGRWPGWAWQGSRIFSWNESWPGWAWGQSGVGWVRPRVLGMEAGGLGDLRTEQSLCQDKLVIAIFLKRQRVCEAPPQGHTAGGCGMRIRPELVVMAKLWPEGGGRQEGCYLSTAVRCKCVLMPLYAHMHSRVAWPTCFWAPFTL